MKSVIHLFAYIAPILFSPNLLLAQCEITPTITLIPSDGPIAGFGRSLAMNDQWLVIGATEYSYGFVDRGAVYLFRNTGNGWVEHQKLVPSDVVDGDGFGSSVAISADRIAIGAPFRNYGQGPGAVYIFHFDGTSWMEDQRIESPEPASHQHFGHSVAIQGDRLVVGLAPQSGATRAYVFEKPLMSWIAVEALEYFSDAPNYGTIVALDSTFALIGVPAANTSFTGEDLIAVFSKEGSAWALKSPVTRPYQPFYAGVGFGSSMALASDRLVVGGDGSYNIPGLSFPGTVYVFQRSGDTWNQEALLQANDGAHADHFGAAVAVSGDQIIVSAIIDAPKGSAYIFKKLEDGRWKQIRKVQPPSATFFDHFGESLAANSTSFAAGARNSDRVFIYGLEGDCNNNGKVDQCEIASLGVVDCNGNEVPDSCESGADCNANSIQDICEIASGSSLDCNENQIPDECESLLDCNANSVQDICEQSGDCQQNGIPDSCEIGNDPSLDQNVDGVPDECQCHSCTPVGQFDGPCFSLKAVAVNAHSITPANQVTAHPGDSITAEVFVSCWGNFILEAATFECKTTNAQAAVSGDSGTILPFGWDAPFVSDSCPCDDPRYPICGPSGTCVGQNHHPEDGVFMDTFRSDFLLAGFETFSAADVSTLNVRFGATISSFGGVVDRGAARYCGTEILVVSLDAQGDFHFDLETGPYGSQVFDQYTIMLLSGHVEGLNIHVQCDDGLYCNGVESFDGTSCQPGLVPCDDGVECTTDNCNENQRTCSHTEDSSLCDDGDPGTFDECRPTGCTHASSIPTASTWGLIILAGALLIIAKWHFRPAHRRVEV